jgi:cytochrome c oxidase subunit 4
MLVICFFMHLIWEANWKYVLTIPASLMSVFLVVALVPDVGQRTRYYAEERSLYASEDEGAEAEPAVEASGDSTGGANEGTGEATLDEASKGATPAGGADAAAKADST